MGNGANVGLGVAALAVGDGVRGVKVGEGVMGKVGLLRGVV